MAFRFVRLTWFAAVLAACGDQAPDYPKEYAPLQRVWFRRVAGTCADIRGTYALVTPDRATDHPAAFDETFLHQATSLGSRRFPWETITIEGEMRDSLVLTVSRSDSSVAAYRTFAAENHVEAYHEWTKLQDPAVRRSGQFALMSDSAYAANLALLTLAGRDSVVLRYGVGYDCDGGWVRSPRVVTARDAAGAPAADTDGDGAIWLATSDDGALVARVTVPSARTLPLWCGDGCTGISLGTGTVTRWARLRRGEPARLTPDPRPWAIARSNVGDGVAPALPAPAPASDGRTLESHLRDVPVPDGMTVTETQSAGDAVEITARGRSRAQVAAYMRALGADVVLDPMLIEIASRPDGELVAVIRVQRRQ